MGWATAYNKKGFKIETQKPSKIVRWIVKKMPSRSKILDLGCGNGRNAIFLARNNFRVYAVDLVDLHFISDMGGPLRKRIKFSRRSVVNMRYSKGYRGIVMARLIPYLSPRELITVFKKTNRSLVKNGLLAISYNARPRKLDLIYGVKTFNHKISFIKDILTKSGYKIVKYEKGYITKYVPHKNPAETYDILCIKNV